MWLRNMLSRWKSSGTPPEYLEVFFGGFPDDFFPETSRFSPGHPQGSLLKNILPSIGVIGEFISLMEVSKAMAERSNVVGGWGGVLISVMSEARKEKLNKIQICQIHILQKSPILRRHRLWTAHKYGKKAKGIPIIFTISLLPHVLKILNYRNLVHRFDNRWRWCRGHFNFRQRTL